MSFSRRKYFLYLLCLAWLGSFWQCRPFSESENPSVTGPSTETGNPTLVGLVVDIHGTPISNAELILMLWPKDDTSRAGLSLERGSPIAVDSLVTTSLGRFQFDSLQPGKYSVWGRKVPDQLAGYLQAMVIPESTLHFVHQDTLILKPISRILGTALRDANPRPPGVVAHEGILVRLIGTGQATYTDSTGHFLLTEIPAGFFSLTFAASDGHYLPNRFDSIWVPAGKEILLDTIRLEWSPVIGNPPSPSGLTLNLDSTTQFIYLQWNSIHLSNFSHYVVSRYSHANELDSQFVVRDTFWVDTQHRKDSTETTWIYSITAIDSLGNPSRASEALPITVAPILIPIPPDSTFSPSFQTQILGLGLGASAVVKLYASPKQPSPQDSLPFHAIFIDSTKTQANGLAQFDTVQNGSGLQFSIIAKDSQGRVAAKLNLLASSTPQAIATPETLSLAAPASLKGFITRQQLWCSVQTKQNENIEVSIAGTPWWTATEYTGAFSLSGLAQGHFQVVVQALPVGCFLPDTIEVDLKSGDTLNLPERIAIPNSDFIPRITGLTIQVGVPGKPILTWPATPIAFPDLAGYEVLRGIADSEMMVMAAPAVATRYTDSLPELAPGTRIRYGVRVVANDGRRGPIGGSDQGLPVIYVMP